MPRPTDEQIVEFLPDALAIRHAKLPSWAQRGIIWMSVFFLLSLALAFYAHVDVIVQAQGKLVSENPNIIIRPLERSVIKELKVHVGDRVAKDQVLITFDPVFSSSDQERLAAEVRIQQARLERLEAEFARHDFKLGDRASAEEKVQKELFDDRQKFYAERESYFNNVLARIKRSQESLKENLRV
ncbi:MAG: hypothetical protein IJU40_04215, partial [Desulfovibrionaceae bacterium]|nr:hypothetical protein [Desulfovibrionaceae bacterium]